MGPLDPPWWRTRNTVFVILLLFVATAAVGTTILTPARCRLPRVLGTSLPAACLPDLKPVAMAGAKGPEWCQNPRISTNATITIANVGLMGGAYTFTLPVPSNTTDFPISVTADKLGQVTEGNETNNALAGTCSR
jgi:hypothetical protein